MGGRFLNLQENKPNFSITEGYGLSLSTPALTELLQTVLGRGSRFTFRAKGFSMSPFIKDGDLLTVSPCIGAPPRLGDVAAFIHPATKKLLIHRLVGKKGGSCLVRGDNTLEIDCPVPTESIIGIVTRVERGTKRVILGLGIERFLIAFLSRRNLLLDLLIPVWKMIRPIARKGGQT